MRISKPHLLAAAVGALALGFGMGSAQPVLAASSASATTASERLSMVQSAQQKPDMGAVYVLREYVNDEDRVVRHAAIISLGNIGDDVALRREAARSLLIALGSKDPQDREMAAIAAGRLGAHELIRPLQELAFDPEGRVAYQALASLAALPHVSNIQVFVRVLDQGDEFKRHRALLSLRDQAQLADAECVDQLLRLALDVSVEMPARQHAVLTLGAIPLPAAALALDGVIQSSEPALAAQARYAKTQAKIVATQTSRTQPTGRPTSPATAPATVPEEDQ